MPASTPVGTPKGKRKQRDVEPEDSPSKRREVAARKPILPVRPAPSGPRSLQTEFENVDVAQPPHGSRGCCVRCTGQVAKDPSHVCQIGATRTLLYYLVWGLVRD